MSTTNSKKTKGRRKVQMVRMEKDSNRRVTFSKRRCGLFKKASELCILCGVQAAIIVFSPGRKAFSFGHPSVDMIIKRFFLSISSSPDCEIEPANIEGHTSESFVDLNMKLTLVNKELGLEKKRGEEIDEITKAREQLNNWWDRDFEKLSLEQLVYLQSSLNELKNNVIQYANMLMMMEASNANHYPNIEVNNNPMLGCYNEGYDCGFYNTNDGFMG